MLRAGGFDNRHGTVTLIDENRRLRETSAQGFDAATAQMVDHFDGALTAFEADVREGKANVKVVSNSRGHASGGGALDWVSVALLLSLALGRLPLVRPKCFLGLRSASSAQGLKHGVNCRDRSAIWTHCL